MLYEEASTTLNFKFTYAVTSRTSIYFNVDNLTRTPINSRYYANESRAGFTRLPYRSMAIGVQGRF